MVRLASLVSPLHTRNLAVASLVPLLMLGAAACTDDAAEGDDEVGESGESTDTAGDTDETADTEESTDTGSVGACDEESFDALRTCVAAYSEAVADCYATTDAPCPDDDAATAAALDELELSVTAACTDGEFLGLSTDAVVGRLRNACESEASSMAWRTYGGPQGAVWPEVGGVDQQCLAAAHLATMDLVDESLFAAAACIEDDTCTAEVLATLRADYLAAATADIEQACDDLADIAALEPAEYATRVAHQVDCLTAAGHPDTAKLGLDCGPDNVLFEATRGEWTQVELDPSSGAICGDGTNYAFQIHLAPEGQPLDRVLIALQGGGVCLFADDCAARLENNPGLFNALDDFPLGDGIGSVDPEVNPFAEWTIVYLPYCNQDVFAGGGAVEDFGELQLPRAGGVNLRVSLRMIRDYLWRELDAAGDPGFRPDELVALFGGFSAGAYGTIYNYHWLLDELQWPRTIAFPDAGLALDNGTPVGVGALGVAKLPVWDTVKNLPSYCFTGDCAIGPVLSEAISPRLKRVPEQQMLILSNPKDNIQQGDAFFEDEADWINTMRQTYCDTKDLPGINYYFTSVSDESIHVISVVPELWTGEVDGETLRDFFVRAVEEPDTVVSRVEEADFVDAIPGVEPYPCEVAP